MTVYLSCTITPSCLMTLPYNNAQILRVTSRANMYWEASLPRGFRRPSEGDIVGCKKFIEDKYRCRLCGTVLLLHATQCPGRLDFQLSVGYKQYRRAALCYAGIGHILTESIARPPSSRLRRHTHSSSTLPRRRMETSLMQHRQHRARQQEGQHSLQAQALPPK